MNETERNWDLTREISQDEAEGIRSEVRRETGRCNAHDPAIVEVVPFNDAGRPALNVLWCCAEAASGQEAVVLDALRTRRLLAARRSQ